jgi:hypothetical protein
LTGGEAFFHGSQIYDPVALLRRDDEILYVARVGMKASQWFMILTPTGEPAWPLRAHEWHVVTPEPIGQNEWQAKTLARLLTERA